MASVLPALSESAWIDLGLVGTYAANWGPIAADVYRPMVRRMADGLVLCRGFVVKSAALTGAAESIFTFNASWWPGDLGYNAAGTNVRFMVACDTATLTQVSLTNVGVLGLVFGGSATATGIGGVSYSLLR